MIPRITAWVIRLISKYYRITEEKTGWYEYIISGGIESAINLISVLLLGIISGKTAEYMIFYLTMYELRRRTGGYHMKESWQCYIMTVGTTFIVMQTDKLAISNKIAIYMVTIMSAVVIMIIGTINHPNLNLNQIELRDSKKHARLMVLFLMAIIVMLFATGDRRDHSIYISLGIIICTINLVLGRIIQEEMEENEE